MPGVGRREEADFEPFALRQLLLVDQQPLQGAGHVPDGGGSAHDGAVASSSEWAADGSSGCGRLDDNSFVGDFQGFDGHFAGARLEVRAGPLDGEGVDQDLPGQQVAQMPSSALRLRRIGSAPPGLPRSSTIRSGMATDPISLTFSKAARPRRLSKLCLSQIRRHIRRGRIRAGHESGDRKPAQREGGKIAQPGF